MSLSLVEMRRLQEVRWQRFAAGGGLIFRPPPMSSPYIIHAGTGEIRFPRSTTDDAVSFLSADGSRYFNVAQDVVIYMPTTAVSMSQNAHVLGGRHVRVIGGDLTRNSAQNNILSVNTQSGSAFVEGLYGDVGGGFCDGIVSRWSTTAAGEMGLSRTTHPGLTIQHCLIEGIDGEAAGTHGDAFQSQIATDHLHIEEFTFEGAFQGIFPLGPAGAGPAYGAWLRKVNSRHYAAGARYLNSYWLYDGSTGPDEAIYPIHLDQVYAGENPSNDWEDTATNPNENHTWGPTLDSDAEGNFFDFSALGLGITGKIRQGQPPGGDFAPESNTGLNYRSPWPVA